MSRNPRDMGIRPLSCCTTVRGTFRWVVRERSNSVRLIPHAHNLCPSVGGGKCPGACLCPSRNCGFRQLRNGRRSILDSPGRHSRAFPQPESQREIGPEFGGGRFRLRSTLLCCSGSVLCLDRVADWVSRSTLL